MGFKNIEYSVRQIANCEQQTGTKFYNLKDLNLFLEEEISH